MKTILTLAFLLMWSVAQAASPSAGSLFTYEGVLTDSTGNPITTTQTLTFRLIYSTSCTVYEETQTVSPGSSGEFSVIIGAGSRTDSTGNTADRIFASSGSVNCEGAAAQTVSGFATRSLHIRVGSTDLSPDVTIGNIPFAINAQKLADKGPSDFVQTNANVTQSNVDNVFNRYATLDQVLNIFSTPPTTGQILVGNGVSYQAGNLVAGSNINISASAGSITISATSTGGISSISAAAPLTVTGPTPTPTIGISQAGPSSPGFLSATDWNNFNTKMSSALESGKIWIGDGTNTATAVAVTGDATLNSSGALSLTNVGSAGTYAKVTTDSKGRVVSGNTLSAADIPALDWSKITSGIPTTLGGYGITDAIKNGAGTPSITSGTDSSKPAAGTAGRLYIATDAKKIYRDNGTSWDVLGGTGAGTVTSVDTGTGLTGGPITGAGTISLANTTVTPGTYGTSTTVGSFTVDAQGRLTSASSIAIPVASSTTTGLLSNTDWQNFNSKLGTISTLSGDVSGTYNSTTVDKIKGKSVAPVTYSAGQVLRYDGTNWVNSLLGFTDITGTVATTQLPIVPVNKGGTGVTTLTANRLLASDGTGSTVAGFSCGVGQLLTFDAAGVPGCTSYSASGVFAQGGNSFGAAASLGTNDANDLSFKTNGTTRMTVLSGGNVGIGTTTPAQVLSVYSTTPIAGQFDSAQNFTGLNVANNQGTSVVYTLKTTSSTAVPASAFIIAQGGNNRLVVDSSGNIGLGTTTPTARLDTNNGNINVGSGTVSMGYETRSVLCNGVATCDILCSGTKKVLGGGCSVSSGTDRIVATYPSADNKWTCTASAVTNITGYVICANIQ